MKQEDEPKVWVIVVKLIVGALVLIGAVGGALMYAEQDEVATPTPLNGKSWGIAGDSPVRMKR
jgi:uncharacterized membrane protein